MEIKCHTSGQMGINSNISCPGAVSSPDLNLKLSVLLVISSDGHIFPHSDLLSKVLTAKPLIACNANIYFINQILDE